MDTDISNLLPLDFVSSPGGLSSIREPISLRRVCSGPGSPSLNPFIYGTEQRGGWKTRGKSWRVTDFGRPSVCGSFGRTTSSTSNRRDLSFVSSLSTSLRDLPVYLSSVVEYDYGDEGDEVFCLVEMRSLQIFRSISPSTLVHWLSGSDFGDTPRLS